MHYIVAGRKDGQTVAGAVCLSARRVVVYWHGAMLESHEEHGPVQILRLDEIRHHCAAGMEWFDFNPSGGQEGVRKFKSSFGA